MLTYGTLAILVILIIAILAIVVIAWKLMPSSNKPTSSKTDVITQPIVQRFVSSDLKKRAFIVRLNDGGFKVIYQRYSNEVIDLGGEVAGWQSLPNKPVTDSLADAVEIAQGWVHAGD
jgi:hypothetical protein